MTLRTAIFITAALLLSPALAPSAQARQDRWGKDYIPNVTLITQDGRPVQLYDDVIQDRTVLISFIYTSCKDICPLITARLAQVYERLGTAAGRDIRFVSITIDPENDTPERMKEHADAFRSDPRWLFLTGSRADIDLVRHKLGERSRRYSEHRPDIMLRNGRTGHWTRDSAFADIDRLIVTIRSMDPDWRPELTAHSTDPGALIRDVQQRPGEALFLKACASCHTVGGGDRVGPDLAGIADRRETAWITRFIQNPSRVRAQGDPYIASLLARFPNVRMPSLQMSEHDAADLVSYLQARSFAVKTAGASGAHHHHHQSQTEPSGITSPGRIGATHTHHH